MSTWNRFFAARVAYGAFLLRLAVGIRLIYGTLDNVLSWERMLEFRDFLAGFGMPAPLVAAVVSVYAQFICGILFILGWQTRPAAFVMIINFLVALLLVHRQDTLIGAYPAISILAASVLLLFQGPGRPSVEEGR